MNHLMSFITKYKSVIIFYFLALTLTWIFWLPMDYLVKNNDSFKILHFVGSLGPATATFLATFVIFKNEEWRRELLENLKNRGGLFPQYLFWFTFPFVVFFFSIFFETYLTNKHFDFSLLFQTKEYPGLGIWYWVLAVFFYGFGEEIGWRGFLLPRLRELGHSPKISALIMTPLWALWHIPLFFYIHSNYASMSPAMMLGWLISLLFGAVVLNYIFYETNKSLFAVALFHGALDIVVINELAGQAILSLNIVNGVIMGLGFLFLILKTKEMGNEQREKMSM